jgi:hypothetical protein
MSRDRWHRGRIQLCIEENVSSLAPLLVIFGQHLLENTQQNAHGHEASEVLNQPSARHDDAPRESQNTKVHGWALELLEQDVAGDFEEHVGNKDCDMNISTRRGLDAR